MDLHFIYFFKLNSSQLVVSNLKVDELNIAYIQSNCTVSVVSPTSEIFELYSLQRILPEMICSIVRVVDNWFAWKFSWNHVVEDSQTIPTVGMRRIVSE